MGTLRAARESDTLMQSKTFNPIVLILTLVFLNAIVAACVHPFNLWGVIVMNAAAIGGSAAGLWLIRGSRNAKLKR